MTFGELIVILSEMHQRFRFARFFDEYRSPRAIITPLCSLKETNVTKVHIIADIGVVSGLSVN